MQKIFLALAMIAVGASFNAAQIADTDDNQLRTKHIVEKIRRIAPEFPVIAIGGKTEATILEVIEAGANAVSYTPLSTGDLFKPIMEKYRSQ